MLNKWCLSRIPRIAHCYFSAPKMSFLRYMTLKSFSMTNPEWKIKFYTSPLFSKGLLWEQNSAPNMTDNTKDWFPELATIPNLEIITIGEEWGDIPNVFKADLTRLKVLGTDGGLWLDADLLSIKNLNDAYFNTEEHKDVDTIISYSRGRQHFSIGYMFSSENNSLFTSLYNLGITRLLDCGDRQTFGVILWNSLVKDDREIISKFPELNVLNFEFRLCYPYLYNNMTAILSENHDLTVTHPDCVALHWYGGYPDCAHFEHILTPDNYMKYDTTLCNCIKEAFKYEKKV